MYISDLSEQQQKLLKMAERYWQAAFKYMRENGKHDLNNIFGYHACRVEKLAGILWYQNHDKQCKLLSQAALNWFNKNG